MGVTSFRFEHSAPKGDRTYFRYRGEVEKQPVRLTVTAWACGDRAFLGFHLTVDLAAVDQGVTRLSAAACP
jgi:hypothetical protein